MSKFEIVMRSLIAAVMLVVGWLVNLYVERWVVVQSSPAIQFADGPEQTFGLDALHLLGNGSVLISVVIAALVFYPVVKTLFTKKETPTDEA